jgi:CTP:molybdopterin cytidylyltransferase MocA
MIAIVILAAGSSSRMQGRDKLMETIAGVPLLRRQVKRAMSTGLDVYVTLPTSPHPRYAALDGLEVTMVPVPDAIEGMNASLRAGLRAVEDDVDAVMVMLGDMPDITANDISTVLHAVDIKSENFIWRASTSDGSAGHPSVFHKNLLPSLIALTGDRGGNAVVKENATRTVLVPLPSNHARTDLDTPEAWDAWRLENPST